MLGSLLVVLAVLTVRARFDDPDMWWHLKMGEVMWNTHKIPATDIFAYTTNHHAYVAHEWLSQVLIFGAYHVGAYIGLMLWLCALSSVLLILGYLLCTLYCGNSKIALIGALTVWLFGTVSFAVRPQLLGYVLLIVEMLFLQLGRTRDRRWFFGLPVLFAVWANCHGSFFLGLVLGATVLFSSFLRFRAGSLVTEPWDRSAQHALSLALALSIAAVFLNPVGPRLILYPLDMMFHQHTVLNVVDEWQPLSLGDIRGRAMVLVIAAILLVVVVQRGKVILAGELLLLALATALAASHERMLIVFGIVAAPILCRLLADLWQGYNVAEDRPLANAVLMAGALATIVLAFPSRQFLAKQVEELSPVKAVAFLKQNHLSGPMLNEFGAGGYLIWAAPEYPVFIDGRADIFDWTGVLREFGNFATLQQDPRMLLNKYGIRFCLVSRTSPLAAVFPLLGEWTEVYSDEQSVIFQRKEELARR